MKIYEPMETVFVVFNCRGSDFVSDIRQVAMDHASEMAGIYADEGPWRVFEYRIKMDDNGIPKKAGSRK